MVQHSFLDHVRRVVPMIGNDPLWCAMVVCDEKLGYYTSIVVPGPLAPSVDMRYLGKCSQL